jgi:hypothetical protein
VLKKNLIDQWDRLKRMSRYEKFVVIIFMIIFISFTINHAISEKEIYDEIERYKKETVGTITKYKRDGYSGRITYYEYHVDGRRYEKQAREIKWFRDCLKTKWCIGKKYVVSYSSKNPSNSVINWDKPVE